MPCHEKPDDASQSRCDDHSVQESSSTPIRSSSTQTGERWLESLFELKGLGAEHWQGIDPDEYVRELRDGWDEPYRSQES